MPLPPQSAPSNVPIPDPSAITAIEITKAKDDLRLEYKGALAALREIMDGGDRANQDASLARKAVLEARLDGMDKTHVLLQDEVKGISVSHGQLVTALEKLFEEKLNGILTKFDGIAVQFRERDIRTDQDKIAASTAVNAALQAQKEAAGAQNESNAAAITKSENSFTKEIDGLKALIATTKDSINSQISNLTGRLDRGEGGATGQRQQTSDMHTSIGTILGIIGGVVGILTLIAILFGALHVPGGGSSAVTLAPPSSIYPMSPSPFAAPHAP